MRVTGFGDYMMHFSPPGDERFWQANSMNLSFTGAEVNVCSALAYWGEEVSYVTRLPENVLAKRAVASLRSLGIHTEHIAWGGERMGVYFLEKGASVRSSQVIYDRKFSSFCEATEEHFDIPAILDGTDVLFFTGITCALTENLRRCVLTLCREAKARGIAVVMDVNYRPTLSSPEEAGAVLRELAPYLSCLIGNEEHLKQLLALTPPDKEDRAERLAALADLVRAELSIDRLAITVRRTLSASDAIIYAAYANGPEFALSREYQMHVVDRVGSGDAFSAGLLYAAAHGFSAKEAVEFGAASNAIKHTVLNDINYVTVDEVKSVMKGGRIDVRR